MTVIAHQRLIREAEGLKAPRPPMSLQELRACTVEECTREQAWKIIQRYEWLGTMPFCTVAYALVTPSGEIAGVAVFAKAGGTWANMWNGKPLPTGYLCRGACVHWAHEHAGSYLVSRATKLAGEKMGWRAVYAYSDEEAGEIGTIYQACNWLYLGMSPGRSLNFRPAWVHTPTGRRFDTRAMRYRLKNQQWPFVDLFANVKNISALHQHPEFKRILTTDKHKYLCLLGNRRERELARILLRYPVLPYPKRTM